MTEINSELSVIIPFRFDKELPYLIERLEEQCREFSLVESVDFLVVDSGSPKKYRGLVRDLCEKYGISYLYHDSEHKKFSIGEARDYGVEHAKSQLITFLDVDLRVDSTFWKRLIDFARAYGVFEFKRSFFVVPCIYLTAEGSADYYKNPNDGFFLKAHMSYLRGEKDVVESFAHCSSVMVVNKHHYMAIGGHRPEFRGHGYEDFEVYHRLMVLDGTLPRADTYYTDSKSWDSATYNGFRSQLSLLGRAALMSNIFVAHIWHPRSKKSSFYSGMQVNRDIWADIFQEFDSDGRMPEPLVDSSVADERVVFFGKAGDNSPNCLREVFPYVGKIVYVSEFDFCDADKNLLTEGFKRFLEQHSISKIVFPNPYGNESRLQIYKWCRDNNFPFVVFERGALPESWFLDGNGFNADSSSYWESNWIGELSDDSREVVENYISSVLNEQDALEYQGLRLSGAGLAQKLRVGNKKVLFVPLQRPSDTVIKYFSGDENGFSKFIACIDEAAAQLKKLGWVVICKKHPLETVTPPLNHAIYAEENTHFLDLLEMSNAVALINSGVGIYSMMLGKPTFVFGQAFYQFEGLNVKVENYSVDDFLGKFFESFDFRREKMLSFVGYLFSKFYSFATPKMKLRRESDGSNRNITVGLDFYKLKIGQEFCVEFSRDNRNKISKDAAIFEKFKLDIHNKKRKLISPSPVVPAVKKIQPVASVKLPSASNGKEVLISGVASFSNESLRLKNAGGNRFRAKLIKFKNNPKKFFLDSKKSHIRFFSKFF